MNEEANTPVIEGLVCAYDLDGFGGASPLAWDALGGATPDGRVRWIHLDFTHTRARQWLRTESGIPDTVVEAMLEEDIRPRSLQHGNGVLTILRGVNMNAGSPVEDMVSIRLWLEPGRIISTRRRRLKAVRRIRAELADGKGPTGPADFLLTLLDYLGERIGEVVDTIDESIESAELAMEASRAKTYRGEFGQLRRKTALIRRYLAPQREALDRLSRMQSPLFEPHDSIALMEATNQMTLLVEDLDLARERAMVAQEEILSVLATEQNTKMYLLSLVAAVFLPLSFLTGLMGMNVAGLPGTENPASFTILAVVMVAIGVGILWLFRLKKWL
ncbi:zinc transporter ZntB [Elongatibacter sediminis]|uniref:Zinc transporter ZntB n=1 Tax=Elongatibacter sediminis TaxID=3119006 RepID=A0AAW9R6Q9_9GAMM